MCNSVVYILTFIGLDNFTAGYFSLVFWGKKSRKTIRAINMAEAGNFLVKIKLVLFF